MAWITSYAVVCPDGNDCRDALSLSGSNDGGVHWTVLDTQQDAGFTDQRPRREFTIAQPAKWNIYRLSVDPAGVTKATRSRPSN